MQSWYIFFLIKPNLSTVIGLFHPIYPLSTTFSEFLVSLLGYSVTLECKGDADSSELLISTTARRQNIWPGTETG